VLESNTGNLGCLLVTMAVLCYVPMLQCSLGLPRTAPGGFDPAPASQETLHQTQVPESLIEAA
jgi:hypothetical protein